MLIVIVGGAAFVNTANWQPFIPENTGTFGQYGWSGILRGAGVIFFAYIGFDAVSMAAQEAKNPQKDMPIGILGSLVICTILYVLVSGVMVGLVPYKQMLGSAGADGGGDSTPRKQAVGRQRACSRVMTMLVELGAIAGLSSVMVVMMMAQPRIFYSMANDGLLPPFAKKIHPKFRTPHITSIITGVVVAIAAGFTPIGIARRAGEHRHAAGVRHRVDRHHLPAPPAAGSRAAVPDAVRAVRADPVGAGQLRSDGRRCRWTPGSG